MNRLHPSTTVAVVLNIAAIACFVTGLFMPAIVLSLTAYFAAIKEVSKYTSWYQFITTFVSAILLGLFIDIPSANFPLVTAALFFAAAASLIRIMYFCKFSYTGHAWFEPLMLLFSAGFYIAAIFSPDHSWQAYAFPGPVIVFAGILTLGIVKDKKQLLTYTKSGYRVQKGKPANDFELPDQDGNLTRLSDFKDQRHVLLIFVRGDWCPGCHMMLRTYEKNNDKFKAKDVMVIAIGPDPVGVNRGMVEKLGLDFKVLADEKQKTAMVYGVQLKEYDNDFAEKYEEGIPLPASFLIDKAGIVRYVSRPDRVGEFLNPALIFPIVDQLN